MTVGKQIVAPEGWKQLPKDVVFHFLWSDSASRRVLLVQFEWGQKGRQAVATLVPMPRQDFETGIKHERITPAEHQAVLPPWLGELEGMDLSQLDTYRNSAAEIPHKERVEKRYLHIAPALMDFKVILTSPDPEAEINRRARSCTPPQNETRYRLWFLTYLCFGRNMWALLPPFHYAGHWDRFKFPETKFGAPSKAYGKFYGHGCSKEMAEKCVESFNKRARLGKPMTRIYEEAMIEDFGCNVIRTKNGLNIYAASEGTTAPTYKQYRYRVFLSLGKEAVHKLLYGEVRYRTKIATSRGRFAEEVTNLMERTEADGYYPKDRPKGYVEGSTLPPLCVVIGRDLLSGKKLGIGFSFGKETGAAYRMMLFCMAVPKAFFCSLFGVPLAPGEWENEGLPSHFAVDRGPGASERLIADIEKRFPIRDISPSWSAQSKATVESSHPSDLKIEGRPTFVQSDLTPVEMARREIFRLIEFNNTANMEDRLDPDSELAYVEPSPCGLWKHYDALFRNDAQPCSVDDAIRTFLTPIEYTVKEDGVYLKGRRFYCEELRPLLDEACGRGEHLTRVAGYTLEMCVRYGWIEFKGRLICVPAMLRIRGDEESMFMSFAELEQWEKARKTMASAYRIHRHATSSNIMQRYKEATGKGYESGKRRGGSPKRTAQSRQEEQDVLHFRTRKKVA